MTFLKGGGLKISDKLIPKISFYYNKYKIKYSLIRYYNYFYIDCQSTILKEISIEYKLLLF